MNVLQGQRLYTRLHSCFARSVCTVLPSFKGQCPSSLQQPCLCSRCCLGGIGRTIERRTTKRMVGRSWQSRACTSQGSSWPVCCCDVINITLSLQTRQSAYLSLQTRQHRAYIEIRPKEGGNVKTDSRGERTRTGVRKLTI